MNDTEPLPPEDDASGANVFREALHDLSRDLHHWVVIVLAITVVVVVYSLLFRGCISCRKRHKLRRKKTPADSAATPWLEAAKNLSTEGAHALPPLLTILDAKLSSEQCIRGTEVKEAVQYGSLLDLLPESSDIVFEDPLKEVPLSHKEMVKFIKEVDLRAFGLTPGVRVSCVVPNGAEAAVLVMACFTKCTIVPLAPTSTKAEVVLDAGRVQAKALIVHSEFMNDAKSPELRAAAAELGISIIVLTPDESTAGIFTLSHDPSSKPLPVVTICGKLLNTAEDYGMMLFTSGTSGSKKCVPYPLSTLVVGSTNIAASWELLPTDKVCNMMPLFHIGGISRNVLSPVLSGGSAILCASFDPVVFWDIVLERNKAVTWYYAGPTMHQMILEEFKQRGLESYKFRFVANAAGGLLPSLALEMRAKFGCTVLPGYGMTECMPITAPPIDYKLDRDGTSGRTVGPELKIFNDEGVEVATGAVGNIVVRGPPLFRGYEGNAEATQESFFSGGWFNTGDLGYLDRDGYLYITGRSKEVINRGGEIISPFEVEEAIQGMPQVKSVIAFSVPHKVLQETIGVALVTEAGQPEPSLRTLRQWCKERLSFAKWPQVLVLMPDLPKNNTNKPLRVKLAERLRLVEQWHDQLTDGLPDSSCTFHAGCPPKGAPLKDPIPNVVMLTPDLDSVAQRLKAVGRDLGVQESVAVQVGSDLRICACVTPQNVDTNALMAKIRGRWHDWEVPLVTAALDEMPRTGVLGALDHQRLQEILELQDPDYAAPANDTETIVQRVWQESLGRTRISCQLDFFEVGGTSLLAGQVAFALQEELGVPLGAGDIFNAPTIQAFAVLVGTITGEADGDARAAKGGGATTRFTAHSVLKKMVVTKEEVRHASSVPVLLMQLVPCVLMMPVRRILGWALFAHLMLWCSRELRLDRLYCLILALFLTKISLSIAMPLVGIALKWLIVGRYREGQYPLFGRTYLQRQFVEAMQTICGRGIFSNNLPLYLRLLGATVGPGVKISTDASLSEPDLLTIGAGVALDGCIVRPFAINPNGCFTLRPIDIGDDCCVCAKSTITGGARLPAGMCVGPLSSSHELRDARPENRASCRLLRPGPPWWLCILLGYPILIVQKLLAVTPTFLVIQQLALQPWYVERMQTIADVLEYFATWDRIKFYILSRVVYKVFAPVLSFAFAVVVKRCIIGVFRETPSGRMPDQSPWELFRPWLYSKLVPDAHLCGVVKLLGRHYEAVSAMYRLVGVKVGKRVYWPGSGFRFTEPDLVELGDYVVFGSRSLFLTSDANHCRRAVQVEAGANVSDRCVLLPGTKVLSGAVLGSGALTKADTKYTAGTYVGSRGNECMRLKKGTAADADVGKSTYARAFTERRSMPYFVVPEFVHVLWCTCAIALAAAVTRSPIVIAQQLAKVFLGGQFRDHSEPLMFGALVGGVFIGYWVVFILVMAVDIGSKWLFMGRRQPGSYAWDTSSYNQRWQLYLSLVQIRFFAPGGHDVLDLFRGSQYLVWYFRALGAKIGHNVCLYPNGADPMMTEPDLVHIDYGAGIDDASLICHLNTKGVFSINTLEVEENAVMRSFSRLQQSAKLMRESVLLEHTLVLPGDTVQMSEWRQGWPASRGQVLTHRKGTGERLGTRRARTVRAGSAGSADMFVPVASAPNEYTAVDDGPSSSSSSDDSDTGAEEDTDTLEHSSLRSPSRGTSSEASRTRVGRCGC